MSFSLKPTNLRLSSYRVRRTNRRGRRPGTRAGASPDAYSEIFADIAVQRKDFENQRGILSRQIKNSRNGNTSDHPTIDQLWQKGFTETVEVLNSEIVTGAEKRGLVGRVIERIVCHKEGGDVYFAPGVFGRTEGENGSRSTFQTTWFVILNDRVAIGTAVARNGCTAELSPISSAEALDRSGSHCRFVRFVPLQGRGSAAQR
jgi:hypothetical protein